MEGGDGVLFVERAGELLYVARLRLIRPEPKRKRVRRGRKLRAADPKPGDLPMARVKPG
ncbi:Uncharacterised protein [Carboxydothermus islandicus]|uniref:Uncharacterized protein n=1 Tax=Carboxydothermus islandicus TaxID=661089 RepID=A0A1L8D4G3_9THEO|nr:Uncharacterised protein [Carboxydothermus islandicus]